MTVSSGGATPADQPGDEKKRLKLTPESLPAKSNSIKFILTLTFQKS
jgi:hypothetical protein